MIETVVVKTKDHQYPIFISDHSKRLEKLYPIIKQYTNESVAIVTSEVIEPLYLDLWLAYFKALGFTQLSSIIIKDGEQSKNIETLNQLYTKLLDKEFNRQSLLIALGGGVIGDIVGFAAATYLRGIQFIQIPTTLLAQVDSSVGGKTAINHPLGKNMIGAFYQPLAVVTLLNSLDTLPKREYASGIAEVVKYGLIYDKVFFNWLLDNKEGLLNRDKKVLSHTIKRCCQIKSFIVQKDEKESKSIRVILNLGHTFGHAIEQVLGYGVWLHGEAVSCGMVIAMRLSKLLGNIKDEDENALIEFLEFFDLPIQLPELIDKKLVFDAIKRDKKNKTNQINYVILTEIGHAKLVDNVDPLMVESVLS